MVFTSLIFTYIFLPTVLILYYGTRGKYRNYVLLLTSLIFYAYGEPKFVFVMLGSILGNYGVAILVDKYRDKKLSKFWMGIDIAINLGLLFVFKYLDFSIGTLNLLFKNSIPRAGLVLPIGISFFTFQALSYVIDVYRGTVKVQRNPLYLALYISFFPQLIAGPIVRYSDIENQIVNRKFSWDVFSRGGKRFLIGFSKKVIIANNLAVVATEVFSMNAKTTNPLLLWLASICFSLQIFYDFSGYSDMAIGLGELFGFKFLENFDYPYISKSVTEFWRRWHMSLGQWFRDYVYIPLGGSKTTLLKHIRNMFIVWLLTGIWHGANYTFILWGLIYFVLLVIEKYIVKPEKRSLFFSKVIWRTITLLAVNFAWVIFNSTTWQEGIEFCLAMVGCFGVKTTIDPSIYRYLREYGIFLLSGIFFSTPLMKQFEEALENTKFKYIKSVVEPILCAVLFLWALSYILLGAHNPFIYFNF